MTATVSLSALTQIPPRCWKFALSGTYGLDQSHYRGKLFRWVNTYPTYGCYCNKANSVELSADGALLNLPAGEARVAMGGGLRTNFFHAYRTLGTAQNIAVSQQDYAYGELSVPLVSPDMGVTGIDRLNLSAALRYDNYPGVGKVSTPKLGLIYAPSPDIDIKGSWGARSRRRHSSSSITVWASPHGARPMPGTGYPSTASVLLLTGGNPNLKPERAETWSATAALHPRALEGAQLEVLFPGRLPRPNCRPDHLSHAIAEQPDLCADLVDLNPSDAAKAAVWPMPGLLQCAGPDLLSGRCRAIVHDSSTNASSQKIYGVDATARYKHSFDKDRSLTFNLRASYLHISETERIAADHHTCGHPVQSAPCSRQWRTIRAPDLTLSTSLNYTGGLNDTRTARTARIGATMIRIWPPHSRRKRPMGRCTAWPSHCRSPMRSMPRPPDLRSDL
jgi:outer membrane receptor protein involved in Fe transport